MSSEHVHCKSASFMWHTQHWFENCVHVQRKQPQHCECRTEIWSNFFLFYFVVNNFFVRKLQPKWNIAHRITSIATVRKVLMAKTELVHFSLHSKWSMIGDWPSFLALKLMRCAPLCSHNRYALRLVKTSFRTISPHIFSFHLSLS